MKNLDSISIDHSTSDQDYHSKESLNVLVQTMSHSRDGEPTPDNNNGSSMRSQRPSRTTTGSLTHLTSNPMEDQPISDVQLPTQDGGNFSDTKEPQLSMRKERSLKSKVELTTKTEILESTLKRMPFTNNGISSILMNGKVSQRKENLTKDSECMLKETSILFQLYQIIDTLISLTTETWLSRLQMVEEPKFGISTNSH